MARDDETSALELRIEVNGPNLAAIPEKCNVSTLRLPSDPSWPKIPSRRLTDNSNDVIKTPCVVTVKETPRNRSIVRTTTCQHPKTTTTTINRKCETSTHVSERLPGYIDPRFKRQISRQKAEETSGISDARNDGKQAEPELHAREARKLEDNSRETDTNGDIRSCHDRSSERTVRESTKEIVDHPADEEQCAPGAIHRIKRLQRAEDALRRERKQEVSRPLLLMVDEKKIHALPIDAVNTVLTPLEAASSFARAPPCYSVQIPVVSYHVPLQVPSISVQMQDDAKVTPHDRRSGDSAKRGEIADLRTRAASASANSRTRTLEGSENGEDIQQRDAANGVSMDRNISRHDDDEERDAADYVRGRENANSNGSRYRDASKEMSFDKNHPGTLETTSDNAGNAGRNEGEGEGSSNPNVAGKSETLAGRGCNDTIGDATSRHHSRLALRPDSAVKSNTVSSSGCFVVDNCIANGCVKWRRFIGKRIAETRLHPLCPSTSARRRRLLRRRLCLKSGRINANERTAGVTNGKKISQENAQDVAPIQARGQECERSNEHEAKHEEEPRNSPKRKVTLNQSRKAKSFFRKRSRLVVTDSDCTLILPGPRRVRGKQYEKARGCSKVSRSPRDRGKGTSGTNFTRTSSNAPKCRSLTNLPVEHPIAKSSSISLETQELLNKNYWEYYRKLRRKVALAAAKRDKRADESRDRRSRPESQALQQCSVLSCVINNTLRDTVFRESAAAADRRSFSDPAANARNVREDTAVSPVKRIKRQKVKRAGEQLLGVKSIALLAIVTHVALVFLPMIYDYLFDEDYDDDYGNANYAELMFDYVASSFGAAYGGIADALNTIFVRPVRFNRKT